MRGLWFIIGISTELWRLVARGESFQQAFEASQLVRSAGPPATWLHFHLAWGVRGSCVIVHDSGYPGLEIVGKGLLLDEGSFAEGGPIWRVSQLVLLADGWWRETSMKRRWLYPLRRGCLDDY